MTRLLAAVVVCTLAIAAAAVEKPGAVKETPEALVARLGSARFADREAAARALEDLGVPALPALEAARRHPNPEISRRAAEIATRLGRQSDSADYLAPRKIRLSYRNVPLGTAINDLKGRTGINLVLDPSRVANPLRPVTVETGELPAWAAVDAFCRDAGLREVFVTELPVPKTEKAQQRGYYTPPPPPPVAEAVPVTLADGKHTTLPGSRSTALRILALPRAFPGHRTYLGTGDVVLSFDIAPTPGLNWQGVCGVRITRLIDDSGRFGSGGTLRRQETSTFEPFGGGAVFLGGGPGGRVVVMRWDMEGNPVWPTEHPNPRIVGVPLKVATPTARSLRLLEGVVVGEVLIPGRTLATFTNPAQNSGAAIIGGDGSKVTLQEVTRSGASGIAFRVEIRGESPQQRASGWGPWVAPMWPEQSRPMSSGPQIKGFDAKGQPLAVASSQVTGVNDDGVTRTMQINASFGDSIPAKLVVTGPATVAVEVPFRMENVPLP